MYEPKFDRLIPVFEMAQKKYETLEGSLLLILEKCRKRSSLSVQEILEVLSGRGRPLLLIILSLPFCQPIQIPGMSTPFGIVIALLGLRMAFGKNLWMPKKILVKTVSSATLQKIVRKFLHIKRKLRRILYPRLGSLCKSKSMKILNGLLLCFLGLFLALPLPIPFTNLAAGWSIFLMALGILEGDGLFVLLGYLGLLITLGILVALVFSIENIVAQIQVHQGLTLCPV